MNKISKEFSLDELKKMKSKTDIEKFKNTTEREILEQTISDVDTPNLSDDELKEFTLPKERKNKDEK